MDPSKIINKYLGQKVRVKRGMDLKGSDLTFDSIGRVIKAIQGRMNYIELTVAWEGLGERKHYPWHLEIISDKQTYGTTG